MHSWGYKHKYKKQTKQKPKSSLSMLLTGFPPSNVPAIAWATASSVAIIGCSYQVSPLSLRMIWISRSFSRRLAKWGISISTGLKVNKQKNVKINTTLKGIVQYIYIHINVINKIIWELNIFLSLILFFWFADPFKLI